MTLQSRIEALFIPEPNTGCFLWLGTMRKDGYGQISARVAGKQKSYLAHKIHYELVIGSVPEGLQLDHLCRMRCCVNPDHLEPVTLIENVRRGNSFIPKQIYLTHCPQGHPYSGANLKMYKGNRMCRRCNTVQALAYYHRSKGKK